MSLELSFTVYGKPAQMGSKRAFVFGKEGPNPRAVMTDDNSAKRKAWATSVAQVAADAMKGRPISDKPIQVIARFFFARPKSHYGTGKNASKLKASAPHRHSQSPDLDKLERCLNDAMTGIVFRDDKQICEAVSGREWTDQQERCEVMVMELEG